MANRIQISKTLIAGLLGGVFSGSGANTQFIGSGVNGYPTHLNIYSGPMPTDAEINSMSGAGFLTARAANLLIDFATLSQFDSIVLNTAKLKNSAYTAAAKSGQASYFVLFAGHTNLGNGIVGKVTDMLGDGDLKLPSVDIVAGKNYRTPPLSFTVPTQYEY